MTPVIGFASPLEDHLDLSGCGFIYAWLEGVREARLCRLDDTPGWRDLKLYPAGRIFGEPGEYRWQTIPGAGLHAVLLLEDGPLPPGFAGLLDLQPHPEAPESQLILWGEWLDPNDHLDANPGGAPSFHAREIPRIQDYPLSVADMESIRADFPNQPRTVSPCLVVRRYRHHSPNRKDYQGEFLRAVRLSVFSEEKNIKDSDHDQDQSL